MEQMRLIFDMSFMDLHVPDDTNKIPVYRFPGEYIKGGKDHS